MSAHQEHDPESRDERDRIEDIQNQESQPEADAGAAAAEGLDAIGVMQARLNELSAQNAELNDQLLRARAEVENIRRRAQEDVAKARKFGIESFAENLVPVKDSLEAALAQPEQSPEAWKEGVETTLRQLTTAFERSQLAEIAPAPGDKFDPHLHQAISSIPAEQASNTIVNTLQKGYLIADRVLRPALVTVAA